MAPTRMKLRERRHGNVVGDAAGVSQLEEDEGRTRESGGRSGRRKNTNKASTAASSSSPTCSSSTRTVVVAAEEASPDSKCPICLDRFNNLAYLDRCLHRFCFPCIQEWSHNKAECPLCKQPFASILHSVRAEDDFKEYTLRPAPANSSVAATVAMVAAMASAARSNHQMRLMLRRNRGVANGGRRQRRERGGRRSGGRRVGERMDMGEWYIDSPPLNLTSLPHHPAWYPIEDSEEGDDLGEQQMSIDAAERGVIFEGMVGLGGAVAPVSYNSRESRRLMTRLAARQRLQHEGGTVQRVRERETIAFRRSLYRCGIRVNGVAADVNQEQQQQCEITAESFHRNPNLLNRLRPWLRRELRVLYGTHGTLIDIVQRIIMARLARRGLEDTPTIEDELRPFLLARSDHFLHELVSFARSPLSLEHYDLQAVYEPPATMELDAASSSSEGRSVIAISEGEEEQGLMGGAGERAGGGCDDVIQTGSSLSLSVWDDETPGPSYSTAEPSCSLAPLPFSPTPQEAANKGDGEKREVEEEECLIVGYKKPIAERTPELVQLSSDTEEEEADDQEKKEEEKLPLIPTTTPPMSYLPIIPPSTSGTYRNEEDDELKEKDGEGGRRCSWSCSSERSRNSVCMVSNSEQQQRKQHVSEAGRDKRRRKRRRKSGTLYNPNRCIYPAMMHCRSRSSSPFHSSVESSPPNSSWEYRCSQVSPFASSGSPSHSSWCSSSSRSPPQEVTKRPPTPSVSPCDHGEKPGGKRKYKSRHLDSSNNDPTWRPSSRSHRRERRSEHKERRRSRRHREEGRRRERQRRTSGGVGRRCREDRSPSVEIIYEGHVNSSATQPLAHKRRRKRHRRMHQSSSPVIITLDSDSSSSPISSQQTVDFSDLPPLPLLHSGSVGQRLNPEIGELPVDILDQGSNGSDNEPASRSEHLTAVNSSDCSDCDVDVETVEGNGSQLRLQDDKGPPVGAVDCRAPPTVPSEATATTPDLRRESGDADTHLLAAILNELKGISVPTCGLSLSVEPKRSSESKTSHFMDQCEVSPVHPNLQVWSEEMRNPSPDSSDRQPSDDSREQYRGRDTISTSIPSLPALKDSPPLLKQVSPQSSYDRTTSPPCKHPDTVSPQLTSPPTSEADQAAENPYSSSSPTDPLLRKDNQTIPAISPLRRPFISSSTPIRHISPTDSETAAVPQVGAFAIRTRRPEPPADSGSENTSARAESLPHLGFNSLHSGAEETVGPRLSPADFHPMISLSAVDFHSATDWCRDKLTHTDSTSRGSTLGPGTNSNNTTPSATDCRGKIETLSQNLSPITVSSALTTAANIRSSTPDISCRRPKFTTDLYSSSAVSDGLTDRTTESATHHLPPIDSHCTSPSPPNYQTSSVSSTVTDRHVNHMTSLSSTFQMCQSRLTHTVESDQNCFGSNPIHCFPIDSHCKSQPPVDCLSETSNNHVRSSLQSPIEEQSET